jgi:hypothetical protein
LRDAGFTGKHAHIDKAGSQAGTCHIHNLGTFRGFHIRAEIGDHAIFHQQAAFFIQLGGGVDQACVGEKGLRHCAASATA